MANTKLKEDKQSSPSFRSSLLSSNSISKTSSSSVSSSANSGVSNYKNSPAASHHDFAPAWLKFPQSPTELSLKDSSQQEQRKPVKDDYALIGAQSKDKFKNSFSNEGRYNLREYNKSASNTSDQEGYLSSVSSLKILGLDQQHNSQSSFKTRRESLSDSVSSAKPPVDVKRELANRSKLNSRPGRLSPDDSYVPLRLSSVDSNSTSTVERKNFKYRRNYSSPARSYSGDLCEEDSKTKRRSSYADYTPLVPTAISSVDLVSPQLHGNRSTYLQRRSGRTEGERTKRWNSSQYSCQNNYQDSLPKSALKLDNSRDYSSLAGYSSRSAALGRAQGRSRRIANNGGGESSRDRSDYSRKNTSRTEAKSLLAGEQDSNHADLKNNLSTARNFNADFPELDGVGDKVEANDADSKSSIANGVWGDPKNVSRVLSSSNTEPKPAGKPSRQILARMQTSGSSSNTVLASSLASADSGSTPARGSTNSTVSPFANRHTVLKPPPIKVLARLSSVDSSLQVSAQNGGLSKRFLSLGSIKGIGTSERRKNLVVNSEESNGTKAESFDIQQPASESGTVAEMITELGDKAAIVNNLSYAEPADCLSNREDDHLLLSTSIEAEKRLLTAMGWTEEDGDEHLYAPLTEDELNEFKKLKVAAADKTTRDRNGYSSSIVVNNRQNCFLNSIADGGNFVKFNNNLVFNGKLANLPGNFDTAITSSDISSTDDDSD